MSRSGRKARRGRGQVGMSRSGRQAFGHKQLNKNNMEMNSTRHFCLKQ